MAHIEITVKTDTCGKVTVSREFNEDTVTERNLAGTLNITQTTSVAEAVREAARIMIAAHGEN